MEWTRIDRSAAVLSTLVVLLIAIAGCVDTVPDISDAPTTGTQDGSDGTDASDGDDPAGEEQPSDSGDGSDGGADGPGVEVPGDGSSDASIVELSAASGFASIADPAASGGEAVRVSTLGATYDTGIELDGYVYLRLFGPSSSEDAIVVSVGDSSDRVFPSQWSSYEWVRADVSGSGVIVLEGVEQNARIDVVVGSGSEMADDELDGLLDVSVTSDDPITDGSEDASDLPVIEHDLSTRLIDITECTDTRGNRPVLGGNVITPVASDPFSTDAIVTYTTSDENVVSVTVDENANCEDPIRINERTVENAGSHSQPNVLIDGEGNREYFYYGGNVYGDYRWSESGPYARRMQADGSLGSERFARLWTPSETHGFRMNDGRIFVAGSDTNARINIIDTDGSYAWPYSRQVIDSDSTPPNEYVCKGNRFTKAVFHQGEDGRLHVTWGWGGGLGGDDPYAQCPNMQHYRDDSMQVYYAFSEDDGVTWQNLERTRAVEATLCDDELSTCNVGGGIAYNDEDFQVSDTRQRQHRKLWVDSEGNVKLGFIKSEWCDSGICETRDVTNPGAIMLLEFDLDDADPDAIEETMIHPESNYYFGSMQPGDGGLYFYAINEDTGYYATEYFYKDGETTVDPIKKCIRLQGEMRVPNQNVIRVLLECSGDQRSVWLYERGVER